jgi:hypothetical protein
MKASIYEITTITGRRFRIMTTSDELAVDEAMKRMTQYERDAGVIASRRIEAVA